MVLQMSARLWCISFCTCAISWYAPLHIQDLLRVIHRLRSMIRVSTRDMVSSSGFDAVFQKELIVIIVFQTALIQSPAVFLIYAQLKVLASKVNYAELENVLFCCLNTFNWLCNFIVFRFWAVTISNGLNLSFYLVGITCFRTNNWEDLGKNIPALLVETQIGTQTILVLIMCMFWSNKCQTSCSRNNLIFSSLQSKVPVKNKQVIFS